VSNITGHAQGRDQQLAHAAAVECTPAAVDCTQMVSAFGKHRRKGKLATSSRDSDPIDSASNTTRENSTIVPPIPQQTQQRKEQDLQLQQLHFQQQYMQHCLQQQQNNMLLQQYMQRQMLQHQHQQELQQQQQVEILLNKSEQVYGDFI
jgi:hypothetical protein